MTVALPNATATFTGNGVTTVFATSIFCDNAALIEVTVGGVPRFNWSASGLGVSTGFSLTFSSAPTGAIIIRRKYVLTQPTSIQNNAGYLAQSVEAMGDRIVQQIQQVSDVATSADTRLAGFTATIAAANAALAIAVNGAAFTNKIIPVPDTAALRALTGTANGQIFHVPDRGLYQYDSAIFGTDDDLNIVDPAAAGAGRFKRQSLAPYIGNQLTYSTMRDLINDTVTLNATVSVNKPRTVRILGGLTEGDGGACEIVLKRVSGSETTVQQNGLTVAPGFQIIAGSVKVTWPDNLVNAVAAGMVSVDWATRAESVAANDLFMSRSDNMFDHNMRLYIPAGNYWHKNNRFNIQNKNYCSIEGAGIGRTIIRQDFWYQVDGVTVKYDDGTGLLPNPLIPSTAAFEFYDGIHNTFANLDYRVAWQRQRGFWMRSGFGMIDSCYCEETTGRTFAAANKTGQSAVDLSGTQFNQTIKHCRSVRSIGTAISMFGNYRAQVFDNRDQECWAEGITTDACDFAQVHDNILQNVSRQDDQAGYPVAGLWNNINGNGGIGGMGLASCSHIEICNNVLDGVSLDKAASVTNDKPALKWRPEEGGTRRGAKFLNNTILSSPVGIFVQTVWDATLVAVSLQHEFNISHNIFRDIGAGGSPQAEVIINENCTKAIVADNIAGGTFRIKSYYNVGAANLPGTLDTTTGHLHATIIRHDNLG